MTRKKIDIKTMMTATQINDAVRRYLEHHRFVQEPYKADHINFSHRQEKKWKLSAKQVKPDETVWRRGSGAIYSPLFLKVDVNNGFVHLEAWGLSRTWLNSYPFPYGPRMGEGVLEVPGLKRVLNDLEKLLISNGRQWPKKKARFIPEFIMRFRPYSWQGWASIFAYSLMFISFMLLQGSIWEGIVLATIPAVFMATLFVLFRQITR